MGSPVASAQGFLDNTATATGRFGTTQLSSEADERVGLVAPSREASAACVAVLDDSDGVPGMSAGDRIAITIRADNTGTTAIGDVRVSLALGPDGTPETTVPGPDAGDDGDELLEPAETWLYTGDAPIGQDALDSNGDGSGILSVPGTVRSGQAAVARFTCELPIERRPALELSKVADTSALEAGGEDILYTITVLNTGNVTLRDVVVNDPILTPATTTCDVIPVGEICVREARHRPTPAEISAGSVRNVAVATAADRQIGLVRSDDEVTVELYDDAEIGLAKSASPTRVRRGDTVTFALTLRNDTPFGRSMLSVVDRLPPGLGFVPGSVQVDGLRVPADFSGNTLTVQPLAVAAGESVVVTFRASVTAQAGLGTLINVADLIDRRTGDAVDTARADVEIEGEPVFDCTDVIGRVFDDRNRNGVQDEGETGVADVRVATVRGLIATTDRFGRFSIPCAVQPPRTGANFILKLDEASLPRGASLVTENPRVIRVTPGRVARFNFGVQRQRAVEVQLRADAFLAGRGNLNPSWRARVDQLIRVLESGPATLRLTYRGPRAESGLADLRLRELARTVEVLWARVGAPYDLQIERRVLLD